MILRAMFEIRYETSLRIEESAERLAYNKDLLAREKELRARTEKAIQNSLQCLEQLNSNMRHPISVMSPSDM